MEGTLKQGVWEGSTSGDMQAQLLAENKEKAHLAIREEQARRTPGTIDDRTAALAIEYNQEMIEVLEAILRSQNEANGLTVETTENLGNTIQKTGKLRPSAMGIVDSDWE